MHAPSHDGTLCTMLHKCVVHPLVRLSHQPLRWNWASSAIPSTSRSWLQHNKSTHVPLIALAASASNNNQSINEIESTQSAQVDMQHRLFVRALLLSYFACQNQSLFAAKSLIETVLQIYRQGLTYDDMQVTLTMMNLESGYTLLSTIDQDILLSWVALILMTLQETGVPMIPNQERLLEEDNVALSNNASGVTNNTSRRDKARTETEEGYHMSEGMRGFAKHIIQQYLNFGLTFAKLQSRQSMANIDGAASPSVLAMQQNTRLIVLTLEVLRDNHIATAYPLIPKPDPENQFIVSDEADEEIGAKADEGDGTATGNALDKDDVVEHKEEGGAQGSVDVDHQEQADQGAPNEGQPGQNTTNEQQVSADSLSNMPESDIPAEPSLTSTPNVISTVPPHVVADGYKEAMSGEGVISTMDYVYCFVVEGSKPGASADLISLRSSAIRLLICFMGAALQSLYAVTALVEYTFDAYRRGWTAEDVFLQLRPEEFVQAGGMAPLEVAGMESVDDITRELFARWLSLLYITYAQLGVPRPEGASFEEGWAWAGETVLQQRSAEEALSMANFVSHVLQQKAKQEEGEGEIDWNAEWQRVQTMVTQMDTSAGDVLPWTADTADSVPQEEGAAQQGADTRWSDLTLVKVEDASLLESPATQLIAQQVSLVDMAYAHARRQLMTLQELQASTGSEEVEEGG